MNIQEMILPAGLVLLGAYIVSKFMGNLQKPPVCTGSVSQTCLGPLCWSSCQSGTTTTTQGTPNVPPTGPGTFTGTTNTGAPCASVDPLSWWTHPECWSGGAIGW